MATALKQSLVMQAAILKWRCITYCATYSRDVILCFSLHHCLQNGSGAHSLSYPMGTRGSFSGGKVAGA